MLADPDPAVLRALPAGYLPLFRRLVDVAEADERVLAVWLGGSLGRGVADAGSDLDVILTIADGAFGEFAAQWRDWLARVTPTVLARELPGAPGSWHSLTPDCERLDVVTEPAGREPRLGRSQRLLVFDRDGASGAAAATPGSTGSPAGPDPGKLAGITEEFLRQQAIFPAAVVARGDWLLGVAGTEQVHLMLYELFVEANQPLPVMGVKQWSAKLTAAQRACLEALPPPAPQRDAVLETMRAAAAEFRAQAREILAAHQIPWPDALDAAVTAYQARELGWWAPDPPPGPR